MKKKATIWIIGILFLVVFCKTTGEKSKSSISNAKNQHQTNHQEEKAYLGILYVQTPEGVQIVEVFPDSPAKKAGLEVGDMILTANGYPVLGPYTLRENIFSLKPGSKVILEIRKLSGKKIMLEAILEPMPKKYQKFRQKKGF